jgi:hypothetical protein
LREESYLQSPGRPVVQQTDVVENAYRQSVFGYCPTCDTYAEQAKNACFEDTNAGKGHGSLMIYVYVSLCMQAFIYVAE